MQLALPTVAQMSDITNSINVLIAAMIGGFGTILTVFIGAMKWYIPKRFEQQTAERAAQIEKLKLEIQTNNAASNADIERDRVLPQLVSGINNFAASNAQMTQNLGALIQNRIEQDTRMASELHAHTLAVTGVTEGLDELRDEFRTIQSTVKQIVHNVQANTESTQKSEVSSNLAAEQAKLTLELVSKFGLKLDNITQVAKQDTKPITLPQDINVTLHTQPDPAPDAPKPDEGGSLPLAS